MIGMLKDLLKKNRSYRGYDESVSVSRETLKELVDCTRYTASSINKQPFQYYLASDPETVGKIQPLTGWAAALRPMVLPHAGHCPTAFIVICQNLERADSIPTFQRDVGVAAQTILLAAVEKGLGGCMIGNFSPEKIAAALNLPEKVAPLLVIAIGKPDETVVLTDVGADGKVAYYRDENDVHYVPKRSLDDLIINS